MHIREFQQLIDRMYSDKDRARGAAKTFLWFAEEVGELASAIAKQDDAANLRAEFAGDHRAECFRDAGEVEILEEHGCKASR